MARIADFLSDLVEDDELAKQFIDPDTREQVLMARDFTDDQKHALSIGDLERIREFLDEELGTETGYIRFWPCWKF
jgi:hypothetical protein